ncbi:MAG: glutaminase domain-containing protein [Limisphaerales bacterium]
MIPTTFTRGYLCRAVWLFTLVFAGAWMFAARASWQVAEGPLRTRWAAEVNPERVLPEYPRPQMVREDWKNLNGLWEYAVVGREAGRPEVWDGQILVPFAVESALSGVMKRVGEEQRLWYRTEFEVPRGWRGGKLLLHFGAVDWESRVWVNGTEVGVHRGGYDGFSLDVTGALVEGAEQELVVAVWDPTDGGYQPRGKQVNRPEGIWYTPTTGIWQTVWLEPVPEVHIQGLRITPNFDGGSVLVDAQVLGDGGDTAVEFSVLDGRKRVVGATISDMPSTRSIPPMLRPRAELGIPGFKAWSPDSPFLYGLRVSVKRGGKVVDQVDSYFGMRKMALGKDADGVQRLMLNNEVVFQYGPLDQGFWPDGLYTAPTDEALRYDIEMTKELGFNMARKHVKVEPARWYYWCDKLGLLVWQDMPSGNFGGRDDSRLSDEASAQYELELRRMVDGFYNHPSIVMWVPFNEGWGQHETPRYVDLVRKWDPTRLVNNASGWTDRRVGDVHDIHVYPGPGAPGLEDKRAGVLGEFGGLGLPVSGHTWQDEANWGYRSYENSEDLTDAYLALLDKLHPLTGAAGLSAAVYTQTTDVEVEVNGLMTYDRELVKMDAEAIAEAAKRVYTPPAKRVEEAGKLVPPSTPLVACDPYFSIWSPADRLTDTETVHWTGRAHRLASLVRVDGESYRVMGPDPRRLAAMEQTGLEVLPTRTIYSFEGAGIALTLTFMTPSLPEDLAVLSRPVTYVTWDFVATDGGKHEVELYFEAAGELAVNDAGRQEVQWESRRLGELAVLKLGSVEQGVLAKSGDDLRIDWGHLYVAVPEEHVAARVFGNRGAMQRGFAEEGLRGIPLEGMESPARADRVSGGLGVRVGVVGEEPVSRWLMLAYDDEYSIQYFMENLRPYWRRDGWDANRLLTESAREYRVLVERCAAFDRELMGDLEAAGGAEYARIGALAYRQCLAASKFVADANGQVMSFSKENFSNGCIGTSDVFYPMAPQFLLFGPSLAKSFIVPFMNYAASERWKFPFAPHDLGTYPHANGQRYGGGERSEENQMPVEESGNLLILMAAVAQMEGHAGFASLYWPQLERWAEYLKAKGFDPENQLCTDDFAGHLAHNVNLSAKAICGLGSFAKLCAMRGDQARSDEYMALARQFTARWVEEANDGDHFRLAFDRSGTWSQKYNLVWDRILDLGLFPEAVLRKEMEYYKKVQGPYGLPLDNRSLYTKLDWVLWTATLTQDREDFEALVRPVHRFLNETPDRVPMSDWYWTQNARQRGFQARPVVGGVYLPMLYSMEVWKKYASRDVTRAEGWAPIPKPPHLEVVVPTAEQDRLSWRYTMEQPGEGWNDAGYNDSGWKEGLAGFGTEGTPSAVVRTVWNTRTIWLRRVFELTSTDWHDLRLVIHHDEDAQVYVNGVRVANLNGYTTGYEPKMLSESAKAAFKLGANVVAVRCRQTGGGQYIDLGFADQVPGEDK